MTTPAEVRRVAIDHHDRVTAIFQQHYQSLSSNRFASSFTYGRSKIDRFVDDVFQSLPAGGSVLDVGCGTGEYLRRAACFGLQACGIEPAPSMREAARRNLPDARIADGVATALPFDDNTFDAVLLIEVLRYLHPDDIRLALSEARRVLRPSGVVLATLVNRWALDGFYLWQRARQWRRRKHFDEAHPHCEFFDPAEAEQALMDAGFPDVEVVGRMAASLRLVWKASPGVAESLARRLERTDDLIHEWRWTRRFAGHLIACGRVPA